MDIVGFDCISSFYGNTYFLVHLEKCYEKINGISCDSKYIVKELHIGTDIIISSDIPVLEIILVFIKFGHNHLSFSFYLVFIIFSVSVYV